MRHSLFFYVLLLVLVLADAWLLAHPNLLGKIGIWLYKYSYLKTFPRALATVGLATGVALGISWASQRYLSRFGAILLQGFLLAGALVILIQTIVQFSSGSYAHTGAGFKTGAILLPLILGIVLARGLWETQTSRPPENSISTPSQTPSPDQSS